MCYVNPNAMSPNDMYVYMRVADIIYLVFEIRKCYKYSYGIIIYTRHTRFSWAFN